MVETAPPQGAQAALRALRLLKLFTPEKAELSLAEVSKLAGLNKTTTHRLLRRCTASRCWIAILPMARIASDRR